MKKMFSTFAVLAATALPITACAASAEQAPPATGVKQSSYTEKNHPSMPCNLSETAVKNWSDTSPRLPAACTYGETRRYESDIVSEALASTK
jgi:hypothetical protein